MKWNLVAQLPVFAGSSLNGEYIPSRNVLDLEKHSGIFQIWDLGPDWICPSGTVRLSAQGPWHGWKTRPGLVGIRGRQVETVAAVALQQLVEAPGPALGLLCRPPAATS